MIKLAKMPLSHRLMPSLSLQSLSMRSKLDHNHVKPVHVIIFDPWIPRESFSFGDLMKKEGRDYFRTRMAKFFMTNITVLWFRKALGKWKPIQFAQETQDQYKKMIELAERGDKTGLKDLVTVGFYYPLAKTLHKAADSSKGQVEKSNSLSVISQKKRFGSKKPESASQSIDSSKLNLPHIESFVERPTVVHKVFSEIKVDKDAPGMKLAQVTVRVVSEQCSRTSPSMKQKVIEYLVMEKYLMSVGGVPEKWKIAGIYRRKGEECELDLKDRFNFY